MQIYYRVYYTFKRKLIENGIGHKKYDKNEKLSYKKIRFNFNLSYAKPINEDEILNNTFTFLNTKKEFGKEINWNRKDLNEGTRLWKLNLHYFDYLISLLDNLNTKKLNYIVNTITSWIDNNKLGQREYYKGNWNSYCISLRLINWIKVFIIIQDQITVEFKNKWLSSIYNQTMFLYNNLEKDLQGNHLLEDGFGLLWSGILLDNKKVVDKAKSLVSKQLEEQILQDGAHFELSPMYHNIMLYRLLDIVNLYSANYNSDLFLSSLKKYGSRMSSWAWSTLLDKEKISLLNDAAFNIAPNTKYLLGYAKQLEIDYTFIQLTDSGYRRHSTSHYDCIMDVGKIGPDYIPGHAHADTFNFILHVDKKPIIVDTGTSTYKNNDNRAYERSTSAHNTVEINETNSSEVWSSFRVGRRSKITYLEESKHKVVARHDGYKKFGITHERSFTTLDDSIEIIDRILGEKSSSSKAFLNFHPEAHVSIQNDTLVIEKVNITFENYQSIIMEDSYYAPEFHKKIPSKKIIINFENFLRTNIKIIT